MIFKLQLYPFLIGTVFSKINGFEKLTTHLCLHSVVDKLLREPGYQSDTLGDVQEFLKEMLEMYHYEETLMNSTTQAIHSDIHDLQLQLQKQKKQGFPIHSLGCGLCGEHVAKKCGKIFKFTYSKVMRVGCFAVSSKWLKI